MKLATCILLMSVGCSGTTGSGLVSFAARAGGPADAAPDLAFDTGSGYHVTLSKASLHVGAVYLNISQPSSGGPEQPCILPGLYAGEAFGGIDIDLLSSQLESFPASGEGTENEVRAAEVWLTGGDINAADDSTPILQVAGVAARGASQWPFAATVTIGANRQIPPSNPATPGANPICRQRIVSPIPVDLALGDGGTLDLRADPREMFHGVDFATLAPDGNGDFAIPDDSAGAGGALFKGMVSTPAYQFTFTPRIGS